jgi:isopentenyl-diphosphate Delta-isomerase
MEKKVILVNTKDEVVGTAGKLEAHLQGWLHRAFSIFVFNKKGEMLLQQRAMNKYHSGGLWTNACCSHPQPGEETETAAKKRLYEEMGFDVPVSRIFGFVYQAAFENGLTEYEFDHVFVGEYDGAIAYDEAEVMAIDHRSMKQIELSLRTEPGIYTAWFQIAFPKIESWWKENYKEKIA